jgi:hypothetical protein
VEEGQRDTDMANEEGIEIKPRMEEDDEERSSAARKKRKELEVAAASGMAWGAKSFSAAKISSIREKDPGSVSDFGRLKSFCLFSMHSSC